MEATFDQIRINGKTNLAVFPRLLSVFYNWVENDIKRAERNSQRAYYFD